MSALTRRFPLPLAAAAALFLGVWAAPRAFAQNIDTWIGATSGNWSVSTNWLAGLTPGTGDALIFNGTSNVSTFDDLGTNFTLNGLTFSTTAGSFVLAGNSINMTAGVTDNSASLETISLNLDFAVNHSFNISNSAGSLIYSGNITDIGGLTKAGNGLLTLTGSVGGPNTYTGTTTVNAGTLKLDFTQGGSTPAVNIINPLSPLSLTGGCLSILGASSSNSQTFASATLTTNASSAINVTGGATLALGALTASNGGTVVMYGAATSTGATSTTGQAGAGGNGNTTGKVTATGIITTTTGSAINVLQGTGNMGGAAFATVGLYDFAAVSGSSPFTVVGLSQSTSLGNTANDGGYQLYYNGTGFPNNTSNTTAYYDLAGTFTSGGSTLNIGGFRFNTNAAVTFTIATGAFSIGSALVTPNVGAFNSTIAANSGDGLQPGWRNSGNGGAITFWQNNPLGFLDVSAPLGNDGKTAGLASSFIQAGAGTVYYTGVNTYNGPLYIEGGVALINANSGLGNVTTGTATSLENGVILANANMTLDNGGVTPRPINLAGGSTGTIAAASGFTVTVDGVISGSLPLTVGYLNSSGNNTIPGTGPGTATPTPINGTGTVKLTGANTYTGGTILNAGTLNFANNTLSTGALTFNGGGLQWATNNTQDVSALGVTINSGGATFDTNGNNITLANALATGTTGGGLNKAGNGILTLQQPTTYSGGTVINAGTLQIENASGSGTGSGSVTVNSGGTLAGNGSVSGSVSVAANATIAAGANQNVGTLTVNNLTLAAASGLSNSTVAIYFTSGGATNSLLDVTNTLTLNGGGVDIFAANSSTVFTTPGTYDLIEYGTLAGSFSPSNLTVLNGQAGTPYTFGTAGNFITLNIGATQALGTWTSLTGGLWSNTSNWAQSTVPNGVGQVVTFGPNLATNGTVTLDANHTEGALLFNNTAASYTIAANAGDSLTLNNSVGAANITNAGGVHTVGAPIILANLAGANISVVPGSTLTISGTISQSSSGTPVTVGGGGLVVLSGANSYTGGTTVTGGTLNFASGGLSTGTVTLNGGALQWAAGNTQDVSGLGVTFGSAGATLDTNGNNVTLSGSIGEGGAGSLTKAGNGILSLRGSNGYTGGTVLNQGFINFNNLNNFGSNTTITFNGGGLQWATGTTTDISAATALIFAGGNATFDTNSNAVILGDPIGGSGPGSLSLVGNSSLTLSVAETYTGSTIVNNGTLTLGAANLTTASSGAVVNGGELNLNGFAQTLNSVAGSGGEIELGTGTLNVNGGFPATYAGNIDGASTSAINLTLTNPWILTGVSTFNGTLTVDSGLMEVNGTLGNSVTPTGVVAVTSGGIFQANAGSNITATTLSNSAVPTTATAGTITFEPGSTGNFAFTDWGKNNNGGAISFLGGNFSLGAVNDGRDSSNSGVAPSTGTGLIISGGNVTASSVLISTSNSAGDMTINGGTFTIGNSTTTGGFIVGDGSSAARGGFLTMTGGNLTYLGTDGLLLGDVANAGSGTYAVGNITGGTAVLTGVTVNAINNSSPTAITFFTLAGANATLYLGNVGLVVNSPGTNSFANLTAGTVGAIANWTSSAPLTLGAVTFQTADQNSNPWNITLSGVLTGANGLNITGGGVLTLAANNSLTGNTTINSGALQLGNGGTGGTPPTADILNDGALILDHSNGSLNLSQNITGTGSVSQIGTGTARLSGPFNTYSGNTTVNAGTLLVDSLAGAGTGQIIVNSGGTFGGNSTLTNNVTVNSGGTIAPGDVGISNLTVGNLTLGANSNLAFVFNTTSLYDQIVTSDNLIADGNASFALYAQGGTEWTLVGNYDLIQYGSFTGNTSLFSVAGLAPYLVANFTAVGGNIVLDLTNAAGSNTWAAAGGGNWSNSANWFGSLVPNAVNVTATFGNAIQANSTVTLDTNITVGGLNFASSGNYYNIGPGTNTRLTLDNGNSTASTILVSSGNQTISAPLRLSGNHGFGLALDVTTGNSLTISGNISQNSTAAVANNGTGTVLLRGNNTYTGGTTLNAGTLNFNSANNFGSGTLTFNGGILQWASGTSTDLSNLPTLFTANGAFLDTNGNNVTLNGNIGGGGPGNLTNVGTAGVLILGPNSNALYTGSTVISSGTVNFSGTNNFGTAGLILNGGTLQWASGTSTDVSAIPVTLNAAGGTFDVNANAVSLANPVGGNGTGGLTLVGNGSLTLSAPSLSQNVTVTTNSTVVPISNPASLGLAVGQLVSGNDIANGTAIAAVNSTAITLSIEAAGNSTGNLSFTGIEYYTGNTTVNSGTLYLASSNILAPATVPVVNVGGNLDLIDDVSQSFSTIAGAGNVDIGSGSTLTVGTNGILSLSPNITDTGALSKVGSGTLNYSGNTTGFGGTTTVNAGVLEILTGGNFTTAGAVNVAAVNGAELVVNGGVLTANASSNLGTGGSVLDLEVTNNGTANFNGGLTTDLGADTNNLIVINSGNLNIGATGLTLGRTGLSNTAQPTTGSTTVGFYVDGGTVSITGPLNVGSNSGSVNSSANARMDAGNLTVAGEVGIGLNNTGRWSDLDVNGGVFISNDTINGVVIGGIDSGNAIFLVRGGTSYVQRIQFGQGANTGSSVLDMTGGNLYLGTGGLVVGTTTTTNTVTLDGGTLGAIGNWSTSLPVALAGTTIQTADENGNPYNITLSGAVSGTNLNLTGTGILRLAANNTFSGTATINSGTLTLGNGGATGSIPAGVSIVDNGFLAFNRTDSGQVIANPISGTGGLKQVGTGTTSITGANNTYTGNTTVNAGTLLVDSVDGTGTGPILVNANGTFGGNGTTQSDISVSTGGSLAPGGGVGVIGNLTVGNGVTGGNLTLAANTNLDFEFANTTSYDEIFLTANFTAAATNFYLFDTTGSTAWNSVGNYSLIQFGGGFTGNLSSFTTPNLPLYLTSNFSLVGNTIVLTIGNFTGANTWGASGSGNWSNPANWDGGVVPNSPNVTALFGTVISSNATVTVNTNITVGGLTLANSVNSYNIGPGTGTFLTLDNGNATPANISAAGTQTVSSPIVLSGNGGFGLTTFAGPNSTLTLSGNISQSAPASLANNGPGTLILAGTNTYSAGTFVNNGTLNFNSTANFGTGTITFNGGIFQWAAGTSSDISTLPTFFASGGAAFDTNGNNVTLAHSIGGNGTGSLTKLGNGILTLSGNNHFSGGAFLNAGTINFNNVNNFGTGTLTFNGGTLQWASGIATDVSAIPVTFAAAGATFDLNSNNVTLANSFGGNGTGGLTVTGNGDLTLAPANLTYSANVTSGNTAISVSNPAGLGLVLGQIVSGNGITSGTTITAVGTNSISLSVAPNTTLTGTSLGFSGTEYYSGNTTINTGTLTLAGNNTLQSFMNVAVNATGNLGLGGNSSQTLATLTGAGNVALAGGSTLTLAPSSSITFSGDLAGTGVINMNGSGTFNFNGTNTNNGTLNVNTGVFELTTGGVMLSSGAVNVANASGARFEVNGGNFATNVTTIINQTSGAGFLEQNGTANFSAGIRTANSAGTFVEVNGGNFFASDVTIRRNSAAPPDFTTGFVVNGGNVNVGTVELGSTDSTGAMTVNGGNVVATGAVTVGWQTSSGRGGGLQVTNGTLDIEDTVNGLVLNRTNSSGIASQNTTVNFFGGTTTLGKLSIGYDNTTTGGLANITLGNATSSGTLYLGSGGIVVNALTSSDGGAFVYGFDLVNGTVGAVSNWSSNATLTLAGNATIQTGDATGDAYNITLNAPLTGTGNWIETGNGTLILTAPNTYAGTTTISSGTLQIDVGGANGTLGSGGILDNGMLAFNRSDSALVVTNNLSGTGGVAQIGTGTTRLEGTNSYTGNTTINAGTLLVDSSDGTGTGNVVVNSGGTLGGNQSVSGSVFVNTGGTIYPGDGGSVGNLSVGSLALAANTIADFAFNGTPANSLLTVATTNGLTLSTLGVSLFAAGTTQPWITPGNYTLIQYTGTNPSVAGLSMLNGQLGLAYNFTASGGNLLVDLTHVNLTGAWNVNASGNWGTGSNWFGTTPNGTAVLAYFPAVITSNQTVTVSGGNFTVGGLVFGDGLASYTIAPGNGSLTLNNGASPANVTVLSGGGTHYISTPLALTTNGANVTVGSGADLNISGNISGHALLTKLGAGSLELAGPNSFSGNVVLAAGTLNLNTGTALGTGALNITGGNLGNSAGIAVTLTNTNSESWNGNFDFVGPNDLNLGLGGIALVGNRTVNLLGANLTTGGSISGTGFGLTVGGNAILTLNGTNTYTGTTTLNGGTLILNNNNALVASGNVNVAGGELSLANSTLSIASFHLTGGTVDTQVAGVPGSGTLTTTTDYDLQSGTVNATLGGTVNLAKNGNGTVNVLTGLAYTGNTTVNSGTLILNNAASATPTNPLPETTLTVGNTGVLVVGGNYGQVNQALTGLVAGGPGADIEGGNTNNSTLSLTIASGTDTYAGVLGLPGNTSSGIAQNALQLNVDGLGTYAPTGNNTYAGGTLIGSQGQATTVLLTGPNELGTGAVQLYAATIDYTANFTANNTINAQSSFGSAGFLEVPANITVTFGANSGLAGSSNLTKTGNGTLILDTSAANSTYSGITVVAAGNLTLGAPNALQDSDLDYNNQGGVFSFGNNTAATLGGLLGAEALALSNATGGALALSVGNDGNDNTYTGNLSGPGSLNKVGTGNFTLTGNNTYTGGTGVNAGTLILASNFTGNVTINNGGTLQSIKHLGNITLDPGGLLMPNLGNGTFGNLTLSSLTWNTNGTAAIQMDLSNTSTPSSDRINIIGNFTKGTNPGGVGQFVFDFQGTGFFYGAPYTLIQFGSNVGFTVNDFAAINLPGSDVANFILTSNALEFSEVPEPPAAALTLAAFALLFVQRRKRKIASELATASAPRTEG